MRYNGYKSTIPEGLQRAPCAFTKAIPEQHVGISPGGMAGDRGLATLAAIAHQQVKRFLIISFLDPFDEDLIR